MKPSIILFASIINLFTVSLFFPHAAAAEWGYSTITEQDCRLCHEDLLRFPGLKNANPDKHHLLLGKEIPRPTIAPYVVASDKYECLSCHNIEQTDVMGYQISVKKDCLQCHPINTVGGSGRWNVHHNLSSYSCNNCHPNRQLRGR